MAKQERLPDEIEVSSAPAKKAKDKKESFFKRAGKRIARWFREMKSELKKVIWPTKKQTLNNCIVVVVLVVASAIVVWGFDQLAMACVDALISLGA